MLLGRHFGEPKELPVDEFDFPLRTFGDLQWDRRRVRSDGHAIGGAGRLALPGPAQFAQNHAQQRQGTFGILLRGHAHLAFDLLIWLYPRVEAGKNIG